MHQMKGFTGIYATEICNISLKSYFWHIFVFLLVVMIYLISRTILGKVCFYFDLTATICIVYNGVVYWLNIDKANSLTYDTLKSIANVEVIVISSHLLGINKLIKILPMFMRPIGRGLGTFWYTLILQSYKPIFLWSLVVSKYDSKMLTVNFWDLLPLEDHFQNGRHEKQAEKSK